MPGCRLLRLAVIVLLAVSILVLPAKDILLYHYDVWRLQHAVEEDEAARYSRKIVALQGHTPDYWFVRTYNDTTKGNRVRKSAAAALIRSDAGMAESVFGAHINNSDNEVAALAIRNLGDMRSRKYHEEVLKRLSSPNEIVRWSVVQYLRELGDRESVARLREISRNDRSEMVRDAAGDALGNGHQSLGVLQQSENKMEVLCSDSVYRS
jgi:hypothetical protein